MHILCYHVYYLWWEGHTFPSYTCTTGLAILLHVYNSSYCGSCWLNDITLILFTVKHIIRVIKFMLLYLTCIANILLCGMNTDNLFDWRFKMECIGKWMRTKMAVLLYSSIPFPGANCTVPFFRSGSYLGTSPIKVKKSAWHLTSVWHLQAVCRLSTVGLESPVKISYNCNFK